MKVAVMGILERQAKLAGRFSDLDIRYIQNKKTGDGLKYVDMVNGCDHILVNTKFISHKATDNLDRDKVIYIHGGVSAVRNELRRLNQLARKNAPAPAPTPPPPTPPEPTPMPKPERESTRAELYTGNPGDLFIFNKPNGVNDYTWRTRISAVRHYAKHNKGRETEIEHVGNQARIMITKRVTPDGGSKAKAKKREEVKTTAPPALAPPAPTRDWAPSKDVMGTASLLWRETFLDQLAAKVPASVSTQIANDASDAYLKWYRKYAD